MNTDSTISVLILNWSASQLCLSHHSQEPQINVHLKKVPWVNQSWISQEKISGEGSSSGNDSLKLLFSTLFLILVLEAEQSQRPQNTHTKKKKWAENLINLELTERYQYYFSILCSECSHPALFPLLGSRTQMGSTPWTPLCLLPSRRSPGEK